MRTATETRRARTIGVGLGTVPMWLAVTAMSAAPAQACSCAADATLSDAYASAEAVFTGKVVPRSEGDPPAVDNGDARPFTTQVIVVDAVYKGAVRARQNIVTQQEGNSCSGAELGDGVDYMVFASEGDGYLSAFGCNPTAPAVPSLIAQVQPLSAGVTRPLPLDPVVEPTDRAAPPSRDNGPLVLGILAVGGAAVVALLARRLRHS